MGIATIIDDHDDELDPNVELPKLRVRQKELMKQKIASQMKKLKERNVAGLGRDNNIDNIASELAKVEKQIKVLTDASKTHSKVIKPHKKLQREVSYHSDKDINDSASKP